MTFFNQAPALLNSLLFFGVWVGLWLPIAIPIAIALKWRPPQPLAAAQKLPLLASLYALAPLILWGATQAEGVSFADYGLPLNLRLLVSFGEGLLLGVGGIGMLFAVQWRLGWLKRRSPTHDAALDANWQPPPLSTTLLSTLLLGIWVSLTEELIFRGFLLNQLQHDFSLWVAAAIASVIFAGLHLVWEGRENIPQLPGLWLMGMVLVLARWGDMGQLGLAWGLHAGWIWAIATLDTTQAIQYTKQQPDWVTGIADKPLAGIMGILFLLTTGAVIWQRF